MSPDQETRQLVVRRRNMFAKRITIAVALAALALTACTFEAVTVLRPDPGQIAFGARGVNQVAYTVIEPTKTAPLNSTVGVIAVLSRNVIGTLKLDISHDSVTDYNSDFFTFAPPNGGDRVGFTYGLKALPGPGHYVFRVLLGTEVLATGELDVTAPTGS
jgi:hypothetical protein